jgi:hypothetical protein
MLVWKLKAVESLLSEIAEGTVRPGDSRSRAVAAMATSLAASHKGENPT